MTAIFIAGAARDSYLSISEREAATNLIGKFQGTSLIMKIAKIVKKDDTDLWTFINKKIKIIDGVSPRLDISRFIEVFKMDPKINL